jgi:HEAT repeat protein
VTDGWLDKVADREQSSVIAEPKGPVRLALVARDQIARGLGGNLDIRVLLQRTAHYPVVTLVLGPPAALRVPSPSQLAVVPLDIANDGHRAVLTALGRTFELTVDVIVRGRRIRRVLLTAPLADNVGYVLRAADDHLRALKGKGASFERGRDEVLAAGYDLLGLQHADHGEFRDDKLAQLATAQQLRRAIAMARRFVRPSREDYLVCTRGFPLTRWRELRRHVLQSAVAWGLWMGPELAQVAVSEGLARSRRDLIVRLDAGFEKLKTHASAYDIDEEAAEDNAKAIAEEARALGVELPKTPAANGEHTNGRGRPATHAPVTSEDMPQVSGSIGLTPPGGILRQKGTDELLAELDDRHKRVAAALELCERGDARAAGPVIAAVTKLSRAEAVRVLGMSVKFGDAAAKPLIEGLTSSKGFLRHGCALALALLRTEDGTQAVIDLLLGEPTEIWREVARAIGQVGPQGLLPLAANFGRLGERATPQLAERVAWAMAHIAVRGGKPAVETMAHGQSVVAPVARQALELHASAANDRVRVRPGAGAGAGGSQAGKDITVNRAFSRRFFEALEQGLPEASVAGLEALEASGPMELLDESDLLVEEDDEAELDESDLIQ